MSLPTADNSFILEYYERCSAGEIIIGLEMQTELIKLREDILSERYIYDTTEVCKRIKFQEKYCIQTKKPFAGKPITLMLWQKAHWDAVYSFRRHEDGLRRFTRGLCLVGRKNGKSVMFASDGNEELFTGDEGTDIAVVSTDDKTAKLIWQEIANMRGRLDTRSRVTAKTLVELRNKKRYITIFRLSARSENLDGRNIDKAYMDEAHQAKNDDLYEAVWLSMAIKDEPFMFIISTEGFLNGMFLDERLKYARGVLNDEIDDDAFLPWLYTQDSEAEIWQDENSWQKSNPSLIYGVKKWKFLRENVKIAQSSKADRIHTLCKDFNWKQNSSSAWLNEDEYVFESGFDIEKFRGACILGGCDFSETTDLTCAVALIMRPGDRRKYILPHFWLPEDKLALSPDKNAGAKYSEWIEQGLITVSSGVDNNPADAADWFVFLLREYGLRPYMVGYDVRSAKAFKNRMEEYGIDIEVVPQNKKTLTSPMKLCEKELRARTLLYNNNPVMRWCLGNTGISVDDKGLCQPIKVNNTHERRIDGAAALLIAYEVWRRYRTEYELLVGQTDEAETEEE